MLHHLQRSTEDRATKVGLLDPETTLEAIGPAGEPTTGRNHLTLVLVVGNDLSNLDLNVFGFGWLTTEAGERFHGFFDSASLDEITGRVRQEQKATSKDETPGKLNRDRDAVRASVAAVLSGIVDAGSQQ